MDSTVLNDIPWICFQRETADSLALGKHKAYDIFQKDTSVGRIPVK